MKERMKKLGGWVLGNRDRIMNVNKVVNVLMVIMFTFLIVSNFKSNFTASVAYMVAAMWFGVAVFQSFLSDQIREIANNALIGWGKSLEENEKMLTVLKEIADKEAKANVSVKPEELESTRKGRTLSSR